MKVLYLITITILALGCDLDHKREIASLASPGCVELLNRISFYLDFGDDVNLTRRVELMTRAIKSGDNKRAILYNNYIIGDFQNVIRKHGLNTEVQNLTIDIDGISYRYNALKVIGEIDRTLIVGRVSNGLEINELTLDLAKRRMGHGTIGSFTSMNNSINMDILEAHNYFDRIHPDSLPMVLRHEFAHAEHRLLQDIGVRSIYLNSYYAEGTKKIMSKGYSSYMSAEEFYNYAAGPSWIFRSRGDYLANPALILPDIELAQSNLLHFEKIRDATRAITSDFIDWIEELKRMDAQNAKKYIETRKGSNIEISLLDGRRLESSIDAEKRDLANTSLLWAESVSENERKKAQIALLDAVLLEQQMLNKVAANITPQVERCKKLISNYLSNPHGKNSKEEFEMIRQELRLITNMTREHYVGFVGTIPGAPPFKSSREIKLENERINAIFDL